MADDNSNWITPGNEANRGGAYINNNFQQENLTQGVATFDGTDALGEPYNITSETAMGPADTLESKPFLLDPQMVDVFFSFFYQEGGYGNSPEEADTLVLEFFDVTNLVWRHAWSQAGGGGAVNQGIWNDQVLIRISELEYLQPGFQFRFRNYASLSGAFDMWHLDYIRLDQARDSASADTIMDVSILSNISSFMGEYTSVPYDHYLEDYAALQVVIHPLAASLHQKGIKIIKAGKPGFGNHEVAPGVSDHPLDFTFIIPFSGAAKPIFKQIMLNLTLPHGIRFQVITHISLMIRFEAFKNLRNIILMMTVQPSKRIHLRVLELNSPMSFTV